MFMIERYMFVDGMQVNRALESLLKLGSTLIQVL